MALSRVLMSGLAGLMGIASASAADLFTVPSGTVAERLPAVSGVNGKLGVLGGVIDDEAIAAVAGSLSVPVPYIPILGVQIDALAGTWDEDTVLFGGLHIFARDPSIGLIGIYGDWSYTSPEHYGRVGPELEIYLGRISLEATGGLSFGQNVEDEAFGIADIALYPIDDLRLSAGYRYTARGSQAAAGLEYQLPFENRVGVTVFGEGRVGEDDYTAAWGGLRLYWGPEPKSLIRRHREDDPRIKGPSSIASITRCGSRSGEGAFCGDEDDLDDDYDDSDTGSMMMTGSDPVFSSDRRIKTDIVELMTFSNGLKLYEYRYVTGVAPQIGVMAQEVRLFMPDAVIDAETHLAVNYAKVFADQTMRQELEAAGYVLDF
ncbi:MAG: tail fiber domain-containing protein [Pseudomonadota bacterium]